MARMARIERTGGPEVIRIVESDLPPPGPGEVRLHSTSIGLNFIDTYYRSGLYPMPLPGGLGLEAAGVIAAVGDGVTGFAPGDRVGCFSSAVPGAYASERNIDAASLIRLPDTIPDEIAAAVLLKGCTAEFLAERCGKVQPGWTVLVHAAAGGVGQLLTQWLWHLGATVIATVGSEEKAKLAAMSGAQHIIRYRQEDIAARVREITGGAGVPVVFDGVGRSTWQASLASAASRGLIISYGNASGPIEGVALGTLASHGSLFVTRPRLFSYYATPEERDAGTARLFSLLASGALKPVIGQHYRLEEAAEAHRALEAGETSGSTLLMP